MSPKSSFAIGFHFLFHAQTPSPGAEVSSLELRLPELACGGVAALPARDRPPVLELSFFLLLPLVFFGFEELAVLDAPRGRA
jgi:hypothetical protein